MADAAGQTGRVAGSGAQRPAAWILAGPIAVLASWLLLVFVPGVFRLQILYAALAVLSVVAFGLSFQLSARPDPRRTARGAGAPPRQPPSKPAERSGADHPEAAAEGSPDAGSADEGNVRFRLVVEAAPNAMIMIDPSGAIRLFNSQAERLFGYSRAQLLGQSIEMLLPPRLREMHRAVRGAYMRTPQTRRMGAGRDLFGLRRDGVEVPVEIGLNPISTPEGAYVLASIIDITERKRAEQALRASEERFRLVVEDAPNAIIMVDEAGRIALLNAEAERLFGYRREELVGKAIEMLVPERYRNEHSVLRGDFMNGPRARTAGTGRDLYGLRRDGSEVPIEIGLNPIRTAEGAFVLASVVDITERKRAQEQIAAALTEKTVLLNEIHHRVKNNLQVITSLLNLQAARARDPAVQALVNESRNRVQAMALIHQLLFERHDWSKVELGPYLRRLGDLLSSTYGRGRVELSVQTDDDVQLDVQRAVPCGLLVNELVTNAYKHAFPPEGTGRIGIELRREDGGNARLCVFDSGRGLPEDLDMEHIDSLGMQLIPLLAEQVRGTLHIERGPGARFELRFPIDTESSST